MVLSSQQSRAGASRSYMFARRRGRWRRPAFLLLAVAAIVTGALYIKQAGGPNDANADGTDPETTRVANDTESSTPDSNRTGDRSANAGQPNTNRETSADAGARRSDRMLPNSIVMGDNPSTPSTSNPDPRTDAPTNNRSTPATSDPTPAANETRTERPEPRVEPAINTTPPRQGSSGGSNATPDPQALRLFASAQQLVRENRLIEARETANLALHHEKVGSLAPDIRVFMTELNNTLMFSPTIVTGDPFVGSHKVGSGDRMSKIAATHRVGFNLLAQINGMKDPGKIRLGQSVKYIRGPFHAVIDKSEFRMDIYIGRPDSQGRRLYVRSFRVGLGENDSTPVGSWVVRERSKVVNPAWTNPRTNQFYDRDHPDNPIGEYWVGLRGTDDDTSELDQYGIHGTVDPDSIGHQASMGCVRLSDEDIPIVFDMMYEGLSTVIIRN